MPSGVAVFVENVTRLGLRAVGQRVAEQAGEGLGKRLFVLSRRADDHVQRVDRPGYGDVQHRERFAGFVGDISLVHVSNRLRQQRANLLARIRNHPLDRRGRRGPIDEHGRRLADEVFIQLGQHDDVELQAFGLIDRHHAHTRRGRVVDFLRFDPLHEIARANRGVVFPAMGQFDQLHQAAQIAAVAVRREPLDPA